MKKLFLPLLIFTTLVFVACSPDVVTIQVIRNPLIKFDFDSSSSWKADGYSFAGTSRVVVYPADTTQPGKLFTRFTLQAAGKDNSGNNLQLIIIFDAADSTHLIGSYKPLYTSDKGLSQAEIFNLSNTNNLSAFSLCGTSNPSSVLQIQRQSPTERLISGIFQMALCNTRDSTKKINIINGILNDVHY